jgi:undecaprenyl-diphosphatase
VVHHRAGWLDPVFTWLSRIGGAGAVWLLIALVLAALWRRPWLFVAVGIADVIAQLAARGLKEVTNLDRPPLRYPDPPTLVPLPRDASFPSGHAASSFACAVVLSLVAPRLAPALLILAAAIAFSRVYVGVHWPFDVLAGAALGAVIGLAVDRFVRGRPDARRSH